jgi:asparaginyl-tRNA synthetase
MDFRNLRVQTEILHIVRNFFHERGFTEILPVLTSPITDPLGPDPGSTVTKTGIIEYGGQKLKITQSMILHKQLILARYPDLDKIYCISPCLRLEHPDRKESGIHCFEFNQVDFEIAGATVEDIMHFMHELLLYIDSYPLPMSDRQLIRLIYGKDPTLDSSTVMSTGDITIGGEIMDREASLKAKTPFWITDHKREFYDKEDPSNKGHYLNYDLYYPEGYMEALSGGEREYEYDQIVRRMEEVGMDLSEYSDYLKVAKEGKLRPSAGGGFGVERMLRFLTRSKHVRDVQLFPRIPGEKVIF